MGLCTPCAGTRPGAADPTAQQSCEPATAPKTLVTKQQIHKLIQYTNQSKNKPVNCTKLLTKCPKNEARSGAGRLKMLQNRGLEGCCAALGGLLGHLGVGGASGEAS